MRGALALAIGGCLTCAIQSAMAAGVQTYKEKYALSSAHTYVVHGKKQADGPLDVPGTTAGRYLRSEPPLVLAPHQAAVEVRQVSADTSNCTTTMEQGVPPASAV